MRALVAAFALGTLVSFSVPAAAAYPSCTKTVTPSESELAHQKYIAGKQDYDEGNYDSAIRRFRDAYTLDCAKHELLLLISAAYERKGDKQEAVNALEAYVARSPGAPDLATHQAKIENLKKSMEAAKPAQPAAPPPAAAETRAHTLLPWIVTGVGAAGLIGGTIALVTKPELPASCDAKAETCTGGQEDQDTAGRWKHQGTYSIIAMAAGGALLIGGLVWHFLEPTGPKEAAKPKLQPVVTPSFAGMSFGGAF